MICDGCGAPSADQLAKCPYCGRPTAALVAERTRSKQAQAESAERAAAAFEAEKRANRSRAQTAVDRATNHAFWWPLLGMFFCALPVTAVVGLVMGLRARRLVRDFDLVTPPRLTAGLALSVLQIVLGVGLWQWFLSDMDKLDARKADLRAQTASASAQAALDAALACSLVELHLLSVGHGGITPTGIADVACPGRLTVDGERALLDDVRFQKRTCRAHLRYGSEWAVTQLEGPGCDAVQTRKAFEQAEEVPAEQAGQMPAERAGQVPAEQPGQMPANP